MQPRYRLERKQLRKPLAWKRRRAVLMWSSNVTAHAVCFGLNRWSKFATATGRYAYGPVGIATCRVCLPPIFYRPVRIALALGATESISYLKNQQRLTFARVGIIEPTNLEDYLANDGYRGLQRALSMSPADIVQTVTDSGLRGRGGAAFPTGIKMEDGA